MGPDAKSFMDDEICYTDVLAEHGWTCGLSGKWHLGDYTSQCVGRIVDRLEALNLRDNTLLIFASDNGYSCGQSTLTRHAVTWRVVLDSTAG